MNAADYLLKPIEFDRFRVAIQKAINQISFYKENENHILLKQGRELIKCNLIEVLYIKGMQEYLYWKMKDRKIITLGSLARYTKELESHHFARIHKSYIVNLNKVESVSTKTLMINNEELPIGSKYSMSFRNSYKKKF